MKPVKTVTSRVAAPVYLGLLAFGALVLIATPGFSRHRSPTPEEIEASSMGSGTQVGQMFGITVIINEFSSPEDREILQQAFAKGKQQGLINALGKMPSVGHIAITGTLGYELSYIQMMPTPTGRKIRFITQRPIRFGEAWADSNSENFNLTAGELDINDHEASKSTGVLYPLAQMIINAQGQVQIVPNDNPWNLVDLIDWKGTAGVN